MFLGFSYGKVWDARLWTLTIQCHENVARCTCFSFSRLGASILKSNNINEDSAAFSGSTYGKKHHKHHQNWIGHLWRFCYILSRCFLQHHFSPHQGVLRTKALNRFFRWWGTPCHTVCKRHPRSNKNRRMDTSPDSNAGLAKVLGHA